MSFPPINLTKNLFNITIVKNYIRRSLNFAQLTKKVTQLKEVYLESLPTLFYNYKITQLLVFHSKSQLIIDISLEKSLD